ncbi:hypothetical protein VP01_9504g1, partial [Puccinia sorghi]
VVPDALSRQDNVYPREGKAFANDNPYNVRTIFSSLTHSDSPKAFAQLSNPCCRDIRSNITSYSKDYSISTNDLLLDKEKIVVPDNPLKLSILKSRHDSPLAEPVHKEEPQDRKKIEILIQSKNYPRSLPYKTPEISILFKINSYKHSWST